MISPLVSLNLFLYPLIVQIPKDWKNIKKIILKGYFLIYNYSSFDSIRNVVANLEHMSVFTMQTHNLLGKQNGANPHYTVKERLFWHCTAYI